MSLAVTLTDATLATTLTENNGLVVVDVWAEWCAPCRALAPTIEALAAMYAGRATVAKVDFDTNPDVGEQFGVRSIPTVLFFQDGELVDRLVGAYPFPAFVERVDRLLAAGSTAHEATV